MTSSGIPRHVPGGGTHPWSPGILGLLGAWLLMAPATFGYLGHPAAFSDWACGALLVALAAGALHPRHGLAAQWGAAAVGAWLLLAPLALWAPAPGYIVSLWTGILAIVFSVLMPRVRAEREIPGPNVPPGWSYNPSGMLQRAPIITLAFFGFFIAQYMAGYQLGYHEGARDPFFGEGTREVLTSDVSEAFPVPDAGLGAVVYLIEAMLGFAGGRSRWRTMPWMVLLFGMLVVPAGVVAILLIILQPLAVGAWCTFCLATAVITLLMISPASDEALASLQFLGRSRRAGRSLWRTFWLGGPAVVLPADGPAFPDDDSSWFANAMGIHRITPTLALAAVLGAGLMFTPAIFGMTGAAADSNHLVGPLVITFSVIALADVARTVRWLNIPLGLWLAVAPWFLDGFASGSLWSTMGAGLLLVVLSVPRGRIQDKFAGFNRYIV